MTLPWIPRISYGGVAFDLALPQRPWVPVSRGVGGYEESAAGIPSAWEYRRDAMRRMTIRFMEAEWGEVLAWLIHAQRGGQFGIAPDYRGDSYTCYLVAPRMGEDIEPQPGDFPGVWEIDLTIRTVSGATIPGRYYGLTPLIDWSPGQMLSTMHFSRSSPALTRGRDGVWQEAAPGVPRTTWGTDPVTGLLVPRYLTEPGGENLIPWSEDFGQWSHIPGTSVTPVAGAWRVGLDGPVDNDVRGVYSQIEDSIPEGGPVVVWAEVRAGSHDRVSLTLNGSTTSSARHVVVDLSTGDVLRQGSDVGWVRVEPLPDGWWHVAVYYPAAATSVPTRRPAVRLVSGTGQTMTGDGSEYVLVRAAQCELGEVATSLVRTTGAPENRDRDTLYFDLPNEVARPGVPLAIYARYMMGASGPEVGGNPGAWAITSAGGQAPRLQQNFHATGIIQLGHYRSGSEAGLTTVPLAPESGHLVETLTLIWPDNQGRLVGRLVARINGGPLAAADLPPLAPAAAWSAPRLYVGSRGSAPGVYEYEAFRVWEMAQGVWRGSPRELLARARTDRMGVR